MSMANIYYRKIDRGIKKHNKNAKLFFKNVCDATAKYSEYLLQGKMLRPAKIKCENIAIDYPDQRYSVKEGKAKYVKLYEPPILHSAIQSPSGNIGYFFINYTEKRVKFKVELCPDIKFQARYLVQSFIQGKNKTLF